MMRTAFFLLTLLLISLPARAEDLPQYRLSVSVDVASSRLFGSLRTSFSAGSQATYDVHGISVEEVTLDDAAVPFDQKNDILSVRTYTTGILNIRYQAAAARDPKAGAAIIGREVSLVSDWYPRPAGPVRLQLETLLPAGYEAISEADRVLRSTSASGVFFRFDFDHVRDAVTLFASDRYSVIRDRQGDVDLALYALAMDPFSAKALLMQTKKLLAIHERDLGAYPFGRLSLVVMPLNAAVLRPTLLAATAEEVRADQALVSQWFGCSVPVAAEGGNWAAGLAAYLSDHAAAERENRDIAYRRELLLRYSAWVRPGNELSLRQFREQSDDASRAVGEGKGAMVFHMLRRMAGDDLFFGTLRSMAGARRDQPTSWDDVRRAFEKSSGKDLSGFFSEWIDRKGLPSFGIERPVVTRKADDYQVRVQVVQKGALYTVEVPALLLLREGSSREVLKVDGAKKSFTLLAPEEPRKIVLDPDFDVARVLADHELPPLIGTLLAREKPLVVSAVTNSSSYAPLLQALQERGATVRLAGDVKDQEVKEASLAVLGADNPLLARLFGGFKGGTAPFRAVARKNPWAAGNVVVVMEAENAAEAERALPALSRHPLASAVALSGGRLLSAATDTTGAGIAADLRERTIAVDIAALPSLDAAVGAAADRRIVYVGEYHDRFAHHAVQLQMIKGLYRRDPSLAIGMEMFQRPFQQVLDDYISGSIDERTFLKKSEYFKRWVFDYNLYKPIIDFAREKRIPVVALNQRKEVVEKVGQSGMDSLTEEERRDLPAQLDFSDSEYRERLRTVFSQHQDPGEKNFDFFYQSQVLWDETMALSIDEFLKKKPVNRMVVIAGAGHLAYGSGIPKRAFRRNGFPYFIALNDGDAERDIANYLLLPQPLEGMTAPKLMVVLDVENKRVSVTDLPKESVSLKAGVRTGDVILKLDDEPIESIEDIKLVLFFKRPGDHVKVTVLRKRFLRSPVETTIDVVLGAPEHA